jgi:1,4-dihydroxy-2-naphthoate octaprenyltransferase
MLLALPAGMLAFTVLLGARGRALIPVLAGTGMLELAFGVLLGLGLAL